MYLYRIGFILFTNEIYSKKKKNDDEHSAVSDVFVGIFFLQSSTSHRNSNSKIKFDFMEIFVFS